MIKLVTPVFDSGLQIVLECQDNNFSVYLLNTHYNKALNIRKCKTYDEALKNYNNRCFGL